jgi:hypothetical protein
MHKGGMYASAYIASACAPIDSLFPSLIIPTCCTAPFAIHEKAEEHLHALPRKNQQW